MSRGARADVKGRDDGRGRNGADAPGHLERALLELEPALSGAPETRTVDVIGACLARLSLWNRGAALLAAQREEGAVRMKDGEVAL